MQHNLNCCLKLDILDNKRLDDKLNYKTHENYWCYELSALLYKVLRFIVVCRDSEVYININFTFTLQIYIWNL